MSIFVKCEKNYKFKKNHFKLMIGNIIFNIQLLNFIESFILKGFNFEFFIYYILEIKNV